MSLLEKELIVLEKAIKVSDNIATKISSSNVGWHIDHSLKVIHRVCNFLIGSKQSEYKWKFNIRRFIIFQKGSIPRGKAKAPEQVRPPEIIAISDLESQLNEVKKLVNTIKRLPPKSNFDHHIFGKLNLKKTIKFLEIHTKHHIKIINDILNNQK